MFQLTDLAIGDRIAHGRQSPSEEFVCESGYHTHQVAQGASARAVNGADPPQDRAALRVEEHAVRPETHNEVGERRHQRCHGLFAVA